MKNNRIPASVAIFACALACLASGATAHPFHVSVAETEYNPETKRLEVALRVSPEDLETALSKRSETKVRLEQSENIDELVVDYLNDHFTMSKPAEDDKESALLELHWVGKELSTKAVWFFFEIDAPDGLDGLELTNRLLTEEEETQINTVVVRDGKRKTTLRFDKKHTTEVIDFIELKRSRE